MADSSHRFPYEIQDVEPDQNKILTQYFKGETTGFIYVGPKKYLQPNKYRQYAADIYNMPLKPGDILVNSYPRSGTHWAQELVWLVTSDLNYAQSDAVPLIKRTKFISHDILTNTHVEKIMRDKCKNDEIKLAYLSEVLTPATVALAKKSSPRYMMTHLPLSLLPPSLLDTAKTVYVARDPRDVAVSFYHLNLDILTYGYVGDFKTFWNFFVNGLVLWAPYFEHLKEAWAVRNHPNMLFLFYEDMKKDLPAVARRVCVFFGKQYTEEQITKLCNHLSIEKFKNNKSCNSEYIVQLAKTAIAGHDTLVRNGKTGGWREYFDEEMTAQAERWIAENLLGIDLRFPLI